MSLRMRTVLIGIGLCLVAHGGAWAQAAAEKEIRARREAFGKAFNEHKGKEVIAFLDPSLTWKMKDGKTHTYKEVAPGLEKSVDSMPDGVTIKLKIDKVEVKGDTAILTVSETISGIDPQGNKQEQTTPSRETWKKIKGRWMLVVNEEL
jgi:ketosteroid isomerase-like protein